MKYLAALVIALACLGASAAELGEPVYLYQKNADGSYSPAVSAINTPVLSTNASGPFLSGPFMGLLDTLTTATNWGVTMFGIETPHSKSDGKPAYGAGALFLYNFSPYVGAGIGIDWMDHNTTMPSAQMQLSAPLYIGGTNGVRVTPFGFTGIATPISGTDYNNGAPVGIFGAGLGVRVVGGLNAFYAIEQRTGEPSLWNIFGLAWSKSW